MSAQTGRAVQRTLLVACGIQAFVSAFVVVNGRYAWLSASSALWLNLAMCVSGAASAWVVGIAWGVLGYTPAKFASTEPFLLLFFAFYLLLPIMYARKAPAQVERIGVSDPTYDPT